MDTRENFKKDEDHWCPIYTIDDTKDWVAPPKVFLKRGDQEWAYYLVPQNESFHDRLKREYAQLHVRCSKLAEWMESSGYHQLPIDEQEDQKEQLVLMRQYSHILDRRLARLATKN